MRICFMGSPDFAIPCFEALIKSEHDVVLAITQPDRPKGRGHKVQATPVKTLAQKNNIPVLTPKKVNDPKNINKIIEAQPDLLVVVAYGQFLGEKLLNLAPLGAINIHASILPYYRGAAPIHHAIMAGEKTTGVTSMHMAKAMDAGDIILQSTISIDKEDNTGIVHDKLAKLGADVLIDTIKQLAAKTAPRIKQDDTKATYASLIDKSTCEINWQDDATTIFNQIRGLNPWPKANTTWHNKPFKILQSKIVEEQPTINLKPGELGEVIKNQGIYVGTGQGLLLLQVVQPAGKKAMAAADWARGQNLTKNNNFS